MPQWHVIPETFAAPASDWLSRGRLALASGG